MTRIREIKTTFTAGEVSRELLGRGDLRAYDNGALALRNVFIQPTGGVTRRAGLGFIDTAAGDGKLIAFEFNTQQTSLLVITDEQIDVYTNGSFETTITLTASADVFELGHEGTRMRVAGKEVEITDYDSATVVTVTTIEDLPNTDATIDWFEQAFSAVRGYPVTVAFHQDRLVIGGSRDLPNRLWFSKSGDLFNFDLGEGLDDEAIEFAVLSDQVNAIRGIFSGRHLQVFTSGAEWQVTGDPLTPASVQIRRQTRVGSLIDRYIPPINVDGATLFIARNKQEVQEFLYTDLEQAYQSSDLALLSKHIITDPVDMDYDRKRRLLFLVRGDGQFAALTVFRAEGVAAWTLHNTLGNVKSVAVVGDDVYMLVLRGGSYFVEQLDDALNLDSALTGEVGSPATVWSGLDHLEGEGVSIVADGEVKESQEVASGEITLAETASTVEIGLPYTHIVEPLPPSEIGDAGKGRRIRLIEGRFRLQETQALRLDIGRGLADSGPDGFGQPLNAQYNAITVVSDGGQWYIANKF